MKYPRSDGFTLIEVLLAASLLALITASLMGGVHIGRRSWETNQISESLDEVDGAVRSIISLLGMSIIVSANPAGQALTESRSVFVGGQTDSRFVLLSEGSGQWAGLILTEIGLEHGPDGDSLVVWSQPYRAQSGLTPDRSIMKRTLLATGLVKFNIAYFGLPETDLNKGRISQGEWSNSWSSNTRLPELVLVTLILKRFGKEFSSSATVALRQQ